jgi:NAD(P)-dependent dehydrogenase (short-subunit alcohol dehydrogenase family)
MSVKSDVSQNYLDMIRKHHRNKDPRYPSRVLITGDSKGGSIGAKITQLLCAASHDVESFEGDVRGYNVFSNHNMSDKDTLILCHGVTHLDWFENAPMDKVQEIFDVNVVGTYRMAQDFVRQTLLTDYRKRIIIIGSMAHKAVLNGSAAYCASKAALAHLVRCLAWELAPKGYDVFIIHPSNTEGTPMTEETITGLMRYRRMSRESAEAYWNDSPIRDRILSTHEIAELVKFLVEGPSSYLSGAQLELAGGQR